MLKAAMLLATISLLDMIHGIAKRDKALYGAPGTDRNTLHRCVEKDVFGTPGPSERACRVALAAEVEHLVREDTAGGRADAEKEREAKDAERKAKDAVKPSSSSSAGAPPSTASGDKRSKEGVTGPASISGEFTAYSGKDRTIGIVYNIHRDTGRHRSNN